MIKIIEVLKEFSKEPFKNDSFVEVIIENDKNERETVSMHKSKMELINVMNRLQISASIYPDNMKIIWNMIEQYANTEHIRGVHEFYTDSENI